MTSLLLSCTSLRYLIITWHKGLAELKAEASRVYLGVLWWVVEPLFYMGAFVLIFSIGLRTAEEGFVGFLLCGLIPWKFFASTVQTSAVCIENNRGLISQVYFPKYVLVGAVLIANAIKFMGVLVLLIITLWLFGWLGTQNLLLLIPVVLAEILLCAGISALASVVVPLVPDTRLIIDNLLLLTFFVSGIFFRLVPTDEGEFNALFLNPVAGLLHNYRSVLLDDTPFEVGFLLYTILWGILACIAGAVLLRIFDRRFAKLPV